MTDQFNYEKLLRTTQYFTRFFAWYLYRNNTPATAIRPRARLGTKSSLTRKLLRPSRLVEYLRASLDACDEAAAVGFPSSSSESHKATLYLSVVRQFCRAGDVLFDTMTLPQALGVCKNMRARKIEAVAWRFWLVGKLASFLAGVYRSVERTRE